MEDTTPTNKRAALEQTSKREFLAGMEWLKAVDPAMLDALAKRCIPKHFEPGDSLYKFQEQPDRLYIVQKGMVHITNADAVSYFCGRSLLSAEWMHRRPYDTDGRAVTEVDCLVAGEGAFDIIEAHASLRRALNEQFQLQNAKMLSFLGKLSRANKQECLPLMLLQIWEEVQPTDSFTVDFYGSLDHIGAILDATRMTVGASLKLLHRAGAIRYLPRNGRNLRIILEAERIDKLQYVLQTLRR